MPVCFLRHDSPLFDFIESCLRNKHEMVVYEAASAIVHMPNCTARELAPAVSGWFLNFCVRFCTWKPGSKIESHNYEKPSRYCGGGNGLPCVCVLRHFLIDVHIGGLSSSVLQLFCSSPKAALRYAAVRTLNKVSLFSCLILSDVCVVVLIFHIIVVSGSILLLISNRAPQVRTAFRTFSFI